MIKISRPYIAVDLDGTLAEYHGWAGSTTIGAPIFPMIERVRYWLKEGTYDVKIFTARTDVSMIKNKKEKKRLRKQIKRAITKWCIEHIGQELEITNKKTYLMVQQWDDRAIQVIPNMGQPVGNQTNAINLPKLKLKKENNNGTTIRRSQSTLSPRSRSKHKV